MAAFAKHSVPYEFQTSFPGFLFKMKIGTLTFVGPMEGQFIDLINDVLYEG